MRVFSALAALGNISPANAPAMAFNEARLAMFGADGLRLTPALVLSLTFWLSFGRVRGRPVRIGRRFGIRVRGRKIRHGGRI
jgi:hypothetical protein